MPRLTRFTSQSVNGFLKGEDEDISWNRHGLEERVFSEAQVAQCQALVFERRTCAHMAGFRPTPEAASGGKVASFGKWVISATGRSTVNGCVLPVTDRWIGKSGSGTAKPSRGRAPRDTESATGA